MNGEASDLVYVNNELYGTTSAGGQASWGTVFKIGTTGDEHPIYSFKGTPDGEIPQAGLIDVNGVLFGTTTQGGGSADIGTVFSVTTAGVEAVLHRFPTNPSDGGKCPDADLVAVNGAVYGTTNGCLSADGNVFELIP